MLILLYSSFVLFLAYCYRLPSVTFTFLLNRRRRRRSSASFSASLYRMNEIPAIFSVS